MNTYTISQKSKNKHLKFHHYEYIINEMIRFNAENKGLRRNIGKTQFIKNIANNVGTSVSNVYAIIKDATITVRVLNRKISTPCNRKLNYSVFL